jgi:hypothetical protein
MPNTFKIEEYKGSPTCAILAGVGRDGSEYWFSFGLKKAKLILEHIDEIEDFVKEAEHNQQRD